MILSDRTMSARVGSKTRLNPRNSKTRSSKQSASVDEGPKKLEVQQLAWRVLSEDNIKHLKAMKDVDEIARRLAKILSLNGYEENLKEAAQLDYFVAGYWHASREWYLTDEQTSAFFTILHTLLENVKTKKLSLGENFKALQALVAGAGIPNVPSALECFTIEVTSMVLCYVQSTLFQHYALFQYLFTKEQEVQKINTKMKMELPSEGQHIFPPPLEESIPLQLYEKCLAPDREEEVVTVQEEQLPPQDFDTIDGAKKLEELDISAEELKGAMESLAKTTLQTFQSEMVEKITEKEKVMASRLSKMEKTIASRSKQKS